MIVARRPLSTSVIFHGERGKSAGGDGCSGVSAACFRRCLTADFVVQKACSSKDKNNGHEVAIDSAQKERKGAREGQLRHGVTRVEPMPNRNCFRQDTYVSPSVWLFGGKRNEQCLWYSLPDCPARKKWFLTRENI